MYPLTSLSDLCFPARDASPAAWIRSISEPETGPAGDNLVSNEDSYPRCCDALRKLAPAGGAYLGVGPEQNLSLVAASRPVLAFVMDYRRRNFLVHLLHKALMALSVDRVSYLERLTARSRARDPGLHASAEALLAAFDGQRMERARLDRTIVEVRRFLEPLAVVEEAEWGEIATIQARIAGPGLSARFIGLAGYPTLASLIRTADREGRPAHFLALEDAYLFLRRMQLDDRVLPVVGDFAGQRAFRQLGDQLRRIHLAISVVYVSDVEFFLLRSGKFAAYVENLACLPRLEGALIVRTSTRPIAHPERVAGDSSTTVVRPLSQFLERARNGKIGEVDDLFEP